MIAAVFGVRMVLFGLAQVGAALGRGRAVRHRPRWTRVLVAAGALVVAFGLLIVSVRLQAASPRPDAFYSAPVRHSAAPGTEPLTIGVLARTKAWRILYATTREDGSTAVASGVVLASAALPDGPGPVIAWAHGTSGIVPGCAPSLAASDFFAPSVIPGVEQMVARGWVLVATDYVGLGTDGPHPYLIGEGEARSVLDSVRAARQLGTYRWRT
ncbi:lipase family protein [Micromonospora sp. CPCC 206061]|uniref:lipase family protein n=1 Tax=Micromonospora sp. CPCC 206061 TaxID=3122410 RepID=UPI002FF1CFA6